MLPAKVITKGADAIRLLAPLSIDLTVEALVKAAVQLVGSAFAKNWLLLKNISIESLTDEWTKILESLRDSPLWASVKSDFEGYSKQIADYSKGNENISGVIEELNIELAAGDSLAKFVRVVSTGYAPQIPWNQFTTSIASYAILFSEAALIDDLLFMEFCLYFGVTPIVDPLRAVAGCFAATGKTYDNLCKILVAEQNQLITDMKDFVRHVVLNDYDSAVTSHAGRRAKQNVAPINWDEIGAD
jgi:hypothetical protein